MVSCNTVAPVTESAQNATNFQNVSAAMDPSDYLHPPVFARMAITMISSIRTAKDVPLNAQPVRVLITVRAAMAKIGLFHSESASVKRAILIVNLSQPKIASSAQKGAKIAKMTENVKPAPHPD